MQDSLTWFLNFDRSRRKTYSSPACTRTGRYRRVPANRNCGLLLRSRMSAPREVADAGHDRCIVQLRHENVETWLTPQGRSKTQLEKLLEDKERPYYERRMAA